MNFKKLAMSLVGVGAIAAIATFNPACGNSTDTGDDAGNNDIVDAGTGFAFTTGIYKPTTDVTIGTDGCNLDPNGTTSPVKDTTYKIEVLSSTVNWYGNPDGTLGGANPPQPSNGTGTLIDGASASLVRDNDIVDTTPDACQYHLKITNNLTVVGDNQITSSYSATETNHTGSCPDGHDDGCATTWTWTLSKQ